jgi:hypothetical protein
MFVNRSAEIIRHLMDIGMVMRALKILALLAPVVIAGYAALTFHFGAHKGGDVGLITPSPAVSQEGVVVAQNQRGNCNQNITGGNNVINCNNSVSTPTGCPPGMIYSRTHGECIPLQNYGGVIPCSPDDKSFVNGRWISNCR